MTDDVLFEKRADGVGLITLNRPDTLNAMGGRLIPMLGDLLAQCENDREVRCVAITGAGRGFCAGGCRGIKAQRRQSAPPRGEDAGASPQPLAPPRTTAAFAIGTLDEPAPPTGQATVALVNGVPSRGLLRGSPRYPDGRPCPLRHSLPHVG